MKKFFNADLQESGSADIKQGPQPLAINFPVFKVMRNDLNGPHGKQASKLIIKIHVENIVAPLSNISLMLYSAVDHNHYGRYDHPVKINDRPSTRSIPQSFIIGNNEVSFSHFLKPDGGLKQFHHLLFTPDVITGDDNLEHLVFTIQSYDHAYATSEVSATSSALAFSVDTKPSPPAVPEP